MWQPKNMVVVKWNLFFSHRYQVYLSLNRLKLLFNFKNFSESCIADIDAIQELQLSLTILVSVYSSFCREMPQYPMMRGLPIIVKENKSTWWRHDVSKLSSSLDIMYEYVGNKGQQPPGVMVLRRFYPDPRNVWAGHIPVLRSASTFTPTRLWRTANGWRTCAS